jgi:xylose dehydrogenase (NAD/NADP)
VRLGLLSTASISSALLATRGDSDAYEIVAVASRERARAEAYAREWQIPRAHGSYDELLADPEIDAVYVALPNALHHHWTMRALAAGKHVLCEKPYSRNPEDVEQAFYTARQAGLVLMEGYMWRHGTQTAKLLELLPEIGELQAIRASFCNRFTTAADVRFEAELGGGSLLDVGCYCVSGARLLAGAEPVRVYGEAQMQGGVDFGFAGVLGFASGLVATITCSFRAPHQGLEAIGRDGTLYAPSPWHAPDGVLFLRGEEVRVPVVSPYLAELENFAAAVAGRAEPLLGRDDSLGQARVLDALLRSAASARPVEL